MAAKKSPGKSPKTALGKPAPLSDAALDKVAGGAGAPAPRVGPSGPGG